MSKVLLNYAVEFNEILPTSAASLAFLHQIGIVCKPSTTPAAAMVTGATGSQTVPATVNISGYLLAGDIVEVAIDLDGAGLPFLVGIPPLLTDTTATDAAALLANELNQYPSLNATVDGSTLEILAVDPVISIEVMGARIRDSRTSIPGLIINPNGDSVDPATMQFIGDYLAGDEITITLETDVDPSQAVVTTLVALETDPNAVAALVAAEINAAFAGQVNAMAQTTDGVLNVWVSGTSASVTLTDSEVGNINPLPPRTYTPAVVEVTDPEELPYITDQFEAIGGAFDGGLSRVYLVLVNDAAEIPALISGAECDFYTVYGTLDFTGDEYNVAFNKWQGVKGWTTNDQTSGAEWAIILKTCIFFEDNLIIDDISDYYGLFSFGSLLSAAQWRNQQYIPTNPTLGDPVQELGKADSLFDDRLSFYLHDNEQGTRLAFFVAGGLSITTPYINEELKVLMQSDMLNFLSANQPMNIETNRRLLEQVGNKRIQQYVDDGLLDPDGTNEITITDGNELFIVDGEMTTTEAVALWRVRIDALQQLGL